jgi:hypothetical protein
MTYFQRKVLTREQRVALKKLYDRDWDKPDSYLEFRRTVQPGWDCIMVEWCGMWLGIEPDGHTHS